MIYSRGLVFECQAGIKDLIAQLALTKPEFDWSFPVKKSCVVHCLKVSTFTAWGPTKPKTVPSIVEPPAHTYLTRMPLWISFFVMWIR